MSSLVSSFLINPVLRQARRFSAGFATRPDTDPDLASDRRRRHSHDPHRGHDDAISESDEHSTIATSEDSNAEAMAASRAAAAPVPMPSNAREDDTRDSALPLARELNPPTASGPLSVNQAGSGGGSTIPLPEDYHSDSCLPADDGMGDLRRRIHNIQLSGMSPSEKAYLMHQLLSEGYTRSQIVSHSRLSLRPESPASPTVWEQPIAASTQSFKFWRSPFGEGSASQKLALTEEDLLPTYAPILQLRDTSEYPEYEDTGILAEPEDDTRHFGCEHYRRNVKMQCATCERWYTCRLCHDAVEDHVLPRRETKHMLCMFCGCAQKASDTCANCSQSAAQYYCNICKLWSDDVGKPVYHCNECGICRIGRGLGKDFFHCKKCNACIAVSIETTHKCIERATDSDCPICGEYMFSSQKTVVFMDCGHSIHKKCREEHLKRSYKCPICSKSITNMAAQFRTLDIAIAAQPMPDEYQHMKAVVLCNDCSAKTTTAYHWLGLKCEMCNSYNTVQLQLLRESDGPNNRPIHEDAMHEVARHIPLPQSPLSLNGPGTPMTTTTAFPLPSRQNTPRETPSIDGFPASTLSVLDAPNQIASPGRALELPVGVIGLAAETDDSEEEDMLDFWGGDQPRSSTSVEHTDDVQEDEDCEDSDSADDCDDDSEEDEEEEILLFGHR
ncbi:Zf-CHY-domain-containing protein [Pleurostoma richardsiae]|uniref:Zf-CHY-domain-containing protein n=1 Tax=Pleurostoma richardsiae TaxID=41990 RepID=A0AA38RBE1_9PEZI|nr:Zf-CHY-domain-containing protein [Pleurostoma richardsiae]